LVEQRPERSDDVVDVAEQPEVEVDATHELETDTTADSPGEAQGDEGDDALGELESEASADAPDAPDALDEPDADQCPWVGNIDMDDEDAVQAFVDSDCDTIVGDLTLVNSERERLPVVPLRILEGTLNIVGCPRLTSLDGLESLEAATSIRLNRLFIGYQFGQPVYAGMDSLTDLSALSNLVSVGFEGINIRDDVLGGLVIGFAPGLRSLAGLENLTALGSLSLLSLPSLENLEELDDLTELFFFQLEDCACIERSESDSVFGRAIGAPSLNRYVPSDEPCVDPEDAEGSATEP
jgi:hypothetical protein